MGTGVTSRTHEDAAQPLAAELEALAEVKGISPAIALIRRPPRRFGRHWELGPRDRVKSKAKPKAMARARKVHTLRAPKAILAMVAAILANTRRWTS